MVDTKNGSEVKKAQGGMTKKEAVVKSLSDLGKGATPTQLQTHIKDRYGLTMTLKHISTAKAKILKRRELGKPAAPKPLAHQPASQKMSGRKEEPRKATLPHRGAMQGISLRDIETVKDLAERVGASSLKKLIDVMAR
jgi:hypothetical protein